MLAQENSFAPRQYQTLLSYSNWALSLSALVLPLTAMISSADEDLFSIAQLVVSHIGLICSSILVNFSYVARCVAQYSLHFEVR